jgi:hypothetical protein
MNKKIASRQKVNINSVRSVVRYLNQFSGVDLKKMIINHYQKKEFPYLSKAEAWIAIQAKGNHGLIGQFIEEYFFGTTPNNKAERDLPCAELKSIRVKKDKFGRYRIKDALKITKANRNDLVHKTFGRHNALQSKLKQIVIIYVDYESFQLIRAIPLELNNKDLTQARKDYKRMALFAQSSGNLFSSKSYGQTPTDSVITLRSQKDKKNFLMTAQTLKRYHQEKLFCV